MSQTVMSETTLHGNDNEPKSFITSGLTTFADLNNLSEKYLVTLNENEDPKHLPEYRKWVAVAVIAAGAFCATSASSMVRALWLPLTCIVTDHDVTLGGLHRTRCWTVTACRT